MPKHNNELLFASLNQDYSCVSVGTTKGYAIANCEPFGRMHGKNDGATSLVEMLFCTSLIAIVGGLDRNSDRKLQIINTKRQSIICDLFYPTKILGVKLNRKRLVVVLEKEIYMYDISNMKLLWNSETCPNPDAVVALSSSSEPSYLVYPSQSPATHTASSAAPPPLPNAQMHSNTGDVIIFDTLSQQAVNLLSAHKSPVAALALNSTSSMLATASDKGTVIRVFSLPSADKLYQFRRGSYPARVYSIAFNQVSTLLAVSSATDTIHIFKIGRSFDGNTPSSNNNEDIMSETSDRLANQTGMLGGYEAFVDGKRRSTLGNSISQKGLSFGKALTSGAGSISKHLPRGVTEMWEPSRDFAFAKLPERGIETRIGLSSTLPQLMVVSSQGLFYSYSIDLENGGECTLIKQYNLLDSME
ncbi:hypothetical protein E3P99_02002 [Wallemia hederae]|uniref:Autophagy-related protein 18 n=1 Tax=Wallemia hederae TaxID=1540922 RepID=A0A4T0FM49_9BASI|nr:hypothetical protein E3P99_02002 [Wallemia hederae]